MLLLLLRLLVAERCGGTEQVMRWSRRLPIAELRGKQQTVQQRLRQAQFFSSARAELDTHPTTRGSGDSRSTHGIGHLKLLNLQGELRR